MVTRGHVQRHQIAGASRLNLGATLVVISGIGLVGYGIMFLIRNFTGFIALGIVVIALAWYGIRRAERWALLTAFLGPVIAVGIALALHFPYGIGTIGHLGFIYFDALILLVGTALAYVGLRKKEH